MTVHNHFLPRCPIEGIFQTSTSHRGVTCEECLALMGPDKEKLQGFTFPPTRFVTDNSISEIMDKVREEVEEIAEAIEVNDFRHAAHEAYDGIQVLETLIRKLVLMFDIDHKEIRQEVYQKVRQRGNYR